MNCEMEGCDIDAEWTIWINDDSGNRIVDESVCAEHLVTLLRRHSDKDVPWPLYGPWSEWTPWKYVKASEALRMMGLEFA